MYRQTFQQDDIREVVVASEADEERDKKSRAFAASLFAWVEADGLWEGGDADTEVRRPVYAVFGCADGEASAFAANLRCGRRCEVHNGDTGNKHARTKGERWEFMRSARYEYRTQRHVDVNAVALQVFLPGLLRIDGGGMVDKEGAAFVVLPSRLWAERQSFSEAAALRHVKAMGCARDVEAADIARALPAAVATGALFAAYLDRRTRCPLPSDERLYLQILVAAVDAGMAAVATPRPSWGSEAAWGWSKDIRYEEHGLARVGLLPGVAFKAKHEVLEPFLAEQVDRFLVGGKRKAKAA